MALLESRLIPAVAQQAWGELRPELLHRVLKFLEQRHVWKLRGVCNHWALVVFHAPEQPLHIYVGQVSLITRVTDMSAWRSAGLFSSTRHTFVLAKPLCLEKTLPLLQLLTGEVS